MDATVAEAAAEERTAPVPASDEPADAEATGQSWPRYHVGMNSISQLQRTNAEQRQAANCCQAKSN